MFLYNLTLQRATGITHAVHGSFSGTKQQEIIVSRGKILEILRPDPNTGKVYPLLTTEVFGVIRALMPFRLTGGSKGMQVCLRSVMYFYEELIFVRPSSSRLWVTNTGVHQCTAHLIAVIIFVKFFES